MGKTENSVWAVMTDRPRSHRLLAWRLAAVAMVALAGCTTQQPPALQAKPDVPEQSAASQTAAAKMVRVGAAHTNKFLNYTQTEGLRNILGGARGIFIAPDMGGGYFIAGVNSGAGFLMRRHGEHWSDPVFFNLTETSAGLQIGVKQSDVIVLLMTDTAVNNFVNGSLRVGGSGGITLGTVGLSVTGAGGTDGGLELLIISSSQGLALGSGIATIHTQPNATLNSQAYGPAIDTRQILAASGDTYSPARELRRGLADMVRRAWGKPSVVGDQQGP